MCTYPITFLPQQKRQLFDNNKETNRIFFFKKSWEQKGFTRMIPLKIQYNWQILF